MTNNIRKTVLTIATAAGILGLGGYAAPSIGGMIGTDQAVPQQSERERVKALVARPEVAKKLETLGVLPKDAQARVDALTDAEVTALAGRIDALPAGAMADHDLLLVILIVLLVAIAL
jgi:hypothetical protein